MPLLLTLGTWYVVARGQDRGAATQLTDAAGAATNFGEFASYLWQFYLPQPPFLTDYRFTTGGLPAYQVWLKQGWARLRLAGDPLRRGRLPCAGDPHGADRRSARWCGCGSRAAGSTGPPWCSCALVAAALLAGLHWTDYHQTEAGSRGFMQARYLFPLVGIAGLALAGAVQVLPRRAQGAATGIAIGGLLGVPPPQPRAGPGALLCVGRH